MKTILLSLVKTHSISSPNIIRFPVPHLRIQLLYVKGSIVTGKKITTLRTCVHIYNCQRNRFTMPGCTVSVENIIQKSLQIVQLLLRSCFLNLPLVNDVKMSNDQRVMNLEPTPSLIYPHQVLQMQSCSQLGDRIQKWQHQCGLQVSESWFSAVDPICTHIYPPIHWRCIFHSWQKTWTRCNGLYSRVPYISSKTSQLSSSIASATPNTKYKLKEVCITKAIN